MHCYALLDLPDEQTATSVDPVCAVQSFIQKHASIRTLALHHISWLPRSAPFVANDKKVRLNTGLPNKATLHRLCNLLSPQANRMRYWLGYVLAMYECIIGHPPNQVLRGMDHAIRRLWQSPPKTGSRIVLWRTNTIWRMWSRTRLL